VEIKDSVDRKARRKGRPGKLGKGPTKTPRAREGERRFLFKKVLHRREGKSRTIARGATTGRGGRTKRSAVSSKEEERSDSYRTGTSFPPALGGEVHIITPKARRLDLKRLLSADLDTGGKYCNLRINNQKEPLVIKEEENGPPSVRERPTRTG